MNRPRLLPTKNKPENNQTSQSQKIILLPTQRKSNYFYLSLKQGFSDNKAKFLGTTAVLLGLWGTVSAWESRDRISDYTGMVFSSNKHKAAQKILRGEELLNRGRFKESEIYLKDASLLCPDYSGLEYKLGVVSMGKRDLKGAVTHFTKAIEQDSENIEAYLDLGVVYERIGNDSKAIETYRRALGVNSSLPEPHERLGLLLYKTGSACKTDDTGRPPDEFAETELKEALKLGSSNIAVKKALSDLYLKKGLQVPAQNLIDQLARDAPNDFGAQLTAAEFYLDQNDEEKAIKYAKRSIHLRPKDVTARIGLGRAYLLKDQFDKALKNFRVAAYLDPGSKVAKSYLSQIYLDLGYEQKDANHIKKAKEYFSMAIKADPAKKEMVRWAFFQIDFDKRQKERARSKAVTRQQIAQKKDYESSPAHHIRMAEQAIRQGNLTKAAQHYMKAGVNP